MPGYRPESVEAKVEAQLAFNRRLPGRASEEVATFGLHPQPQTFKTRSTVSGGIGVEYHCTPVLGWWNLDRDASGSQIKLDHDLTQR